MALSGGTVKWSLVPLETYQAFKSYGEVVSVADLYSAKIFGASRSFRCECGQIAGENTVGRYCEKCEVRVVQDAAQQRRQLLGKIPLAHRIRYPFEAICKLGGRQEAFSWAMQDEFPVIPLGYRLGPNGKPNAIGLQYEKLVELNQRLLVELGPIETQKFETIYSYGVSSELSEAIGRIIGLDLASQTFGSAESTDTIIGLVVRSILTLDPDLSLLLRSCFLGISVEAQV